MRHSAIILLFVFLATGVHAQSFSEVIASPDRYLCAEGWGHTVEEADSQALASLAAMISISVNGTFSSYESSGSSGGSRLVESSVTSFSSASFGESGMAVLSRGPKAHVARWIERNELDEMRVARREKIFGYVRLAEHSEEDGRIDIALRSLSWAWALLQSLPYSTRLDYEGDDGSVHDLRTWIPARLEYVLDGIEGTIKEQEGRILTLGFSYRGDPVAGLDYKYFDGTGWSGLYCARDGLGTAEMTACDPVERLQLRYEYTYAGQSHIDRDVQGAISMIDGLPLRAASAVISTEGETSRYAHSPIEEPRGFVEKRMVEIMEAVRTKDYAGARHLFTTEGFDIFYRLLGYGRAAILETASFRITRRLDGWTVRSIPMSFSFDGNGGMVFVENVVFHLNDSGLVEDITFGLDERAANDILTKEAWPEEDRIHIVEFLEEFRTAYSLERLDYIRKIFDDNAVIIVGRVARALPADKSDKSSLSLHGETFTRTKYTKEEYLERLERCFQSNEYVNARFAENDIVRAGKDLRLYGIQIRQDWFWSHYGDSGYLFLILDLNDPSAPIIHVRTWQREPDPVHGLFDLSKF